MGTEITRNAFSESDFSNFHRHLREETGLLHHLLAEGGLARGPAQGGYELEAWLIDAEGRPALANAQLLERLDQDFAVPELARFNLELNGQAHELRGDGLARLHADIHRHWGQVSAIAAQMGLRLLMIGSHPGARREDFCLANMSPLQRYRAINEQIFRQRHERPIELDIQGVERLRHRHPDVMLEAATTSFQIHWRCDPDLAVRSYNASKILSGPLVALSANSPFLFGYDLWAESRIPVFEQSIDVGQSDLTKRVSFGIRYAEESIHEVFEANLKRYPVLLPENLPEPPERLAHLRLHNGTIWRWNRPLVGFDPDGRPHLRIEQRVVPAGPSPTDSVANAAFYFGAMASLTAAEPAPERRLPFSAARDNFYACARHGLDARVTWPDLGQLSVAQLLLDHLLPAAAAGLRGLEVDAADADHWLGIARSRVETRRTGSQWQRDWTARHGRDFRGMIDAYHHHQQQDLPVHQWPLD